MALMMWLDEHDTAALYVGVGLGVTFWAITGWLVWTIRDWKGKR